MTCINCGDKAEYIFKAYKRGIGERVCKGCYIFKIQMERPTIDCWDTDFNPFKDK